MRHFYSHLVEIESVIVELDKLDLSPEQKKRLTKLIDSSLHHMILDAVLSQLTKQDKIVFLNHLREDDHGKLWKFLNIKIDSVEEKIKKTIEDLKNELHKDLDKAKKHK